MRVSVLEAKTHLSEYMKLIESGDEDYIAIERYGKPVVKMVLFNDKPVSKRIGIAKDKLISPVDLDMDNAEISDMFGGTL